MSLEISKFSVDDLLEKACVAENRMLAATPGSQEAINAKRLANVSFRMALKREGFITTEDII